MTIEREQELKDRAIEFFKKTYRQKRDGGWYPYCVLNEDSFVILTDRETGKVMKGEDSDVNVRVYFDFIVVGCKQNEEKYDNYIEH